MFGINNGNIETVNEFVRQLAEMESMFGDMVNNLDRDRVVANLPEPPSSPDDPAEALRTLEAAAVNIKLLSL